MPHIAGKAHKSKKVVGSPEVFVDEITGTASATFREHRDHRAEALEPKWVCSVTGLKGLTYAEAQRCEEQAKRILSNFQRELGIPLLYLASRTQCVEFTEMVQQVSRYIENRYFVGEEVDVKREDRWCRGVVAEVHTSLDNEVEASQRSGELLPAKIFYYGIRLTTEVTSETNMLTEADNLRRKHDEESIIAYLRLFVEKFPDGIWKIRDHVRLLYGLEQIQFQNIFWGVPPCFPRCKESLEMAENELDPNKDAGKKELQVTLERYFGPHPSKRALDTDTETPGPVKKLCTKTHGQKHTTKISPKQKVAGDDLHGQLEVGQKSKQKYRIPHDKREWALQRLFLRRIKKEEKWKAKEEKRKEREEERKAKRIEMRKEREEARKAKRIKMRKEREEKRKERAAAVLEEKLKMIEQKRFERAKLKHDFRRLAILKASFKSREFKEDLECEDLKVLPTFTEVQCCIPNENFADFMVLLEFLHSFKEILPSKELFPHGITFEVAERAFSVEESDGTFSDILLLLMSTLFTLQGIEDENVDEVETCQFGKLEDSDGDIERASKLAAATRNYAQRCHGIPLRKFQLDACSISEVVRLHFMTAGGYLEEKRTKLRYNTRGGYSERDDPGLAFCIEEPKLLNDMAYRSIQELALGDKLKIILCLIHQLLTYPSVRDVIDKRAEKSRQVKVDLRNQLLEVKKKRDSLNLRRKEKKGTKPKGEDETQSVAQNVVPDEGSQAEHTKTEREILRKQQEAARKAKELAKIVMGFHVLPLGTDRFFRRYWTFSSLPGLLVEHRGGTIETSSGATYKLSSAQVSDIGENLANSDKENDYSEGCKSRSSNSPTKKMLAENNSSVSLTCDKLGVDVQSSDKCERGPKGVQLHQNVVSATIHGFPTSSEPVWSFCCKEDDFNLLIDRLNARGIREGPLRQVLQKEKERILEGVQFCPAFRLNPTHVDASNVPEVRKSSRNNPASHKDERNFGHPLGTPLPQIWCEMLRDEILDLENRLYRARLAILHVKNRYAWRDALANKTYDLQCERLVWGCRVKSDEQESSQCGIKNDGGREGIDSSDREIRRAMKSPFHFALLSPSDPAIIKAYACAILQVEQGIPKKYLTHTFVADKPAEEISQLERWEMSLMNCTSYSQLYVHLLTLHNNVHWSKSPVKAYCRVCRRRGDTGKLLLCDECNKGYHIYCLKPKLNHIPRGDWYCSACEPGGAHRDSKQHASTSEEPEAKGSASKSQADKCEICGLGSPSFSCSTCHGHFHVECCNPSTIIRTRSSWRCRRCSSHEEKELKGSRFLFSCQEAHGLRDSKSQAELLAIQNK